MEETNNESIEKKLAYLNETKGLIKSAIINKGQELTDETPFRDYVQKIDNIETGVDTSDATALASDIAANKTAYANERKITGTLIDNNSQITLDNQDNITAETGSDYLDVHANIGTDTIVRADNQISIRPSFEKAAEAIGLTADKIIEGNTILGIEGTGKISEDLQEQLDAQDLIIQQLEEELAGKAGIEVKPNIFMQETEPTTKDGIWLKGSYQVDNIISDESVFAEKWNTTKMSSLKPIPYNFYYGSVVSVGTDVYLFGSYHSSYHSYAYKYDILTDTYTQLTNIPYEFYYGSAVAIGTTVYLFGGLGGNTTAYKYDTLTNTYTQLTNISYSFFYGSVVSMGTDIYLFGSYSNSYRKYVYKYDTTTDTYTQLTNIPYDFYDGSAASIGTDIYLFGGTGSRTTAYKYDTLTNTYTQLTNIPYSFSSGSVVSVDKTVYLFGGQSNQTKVQVFAFSVKDYDNNSIIIQTSPKTRETDLITTNVINGLPYGFHDFYYYTTEGGLDNVIEKYYGNGTEWVKISGGEE